MLRSKCNTGSGERERKDLKCFVYNFTLAGYRVPVYETTGKLRNKRFEKKTP
ncbi:UNVERIFIED_CONTAM: hypothetical protein FKN15_064257 [Acipenser sinensis]